MIKNLVSVIIPTYNRCSLLGTTLDSLMRQSYSNWECIVVDDGSTDVTAELMELYCEKDQRIKFIQRPAERTRGASSCRNYGFENSKGEFIQYLDSDDVISDEKFHFQVNRLKEIPGADIAICRWGRFRDKVDQAIVYEDLPVYTDFHSVFDFFSALAESKGYFPPHVYLIRRKMIEITGNWNESLSLNDDGEFMARVILKSRGISFAEGAICYYRLPGPENLSLFKDYKAVRNAVYSWILIETYMKIQFGGTNKFIKKAKDGLYLNLKHSFPELITEHHYFFQEQRRNSLLNSNYFSRIQKKLKRIVSSYGSSRV